MEFTDDGIHIDKEPNALDELILDLVTVLDTVGVDYAVVSGYVAVLFGRSRSTEDIDVLVERFDEETAEKIAEQLRDAGYWGSAMPLDELYETLVDGLPIRVAEDGDIVPNLELKFPTDEYDRLSLEDTTTVWLADHSICIGSLELQIAYKLGMGTKKDFEDAVHLYRVAEPTLNTGRLEEYVERLGVQDDYERLRNA